MHVFKALVVSAFLLAAPVHAQRGYDTALSLIKIFLAVASGDPVQYPLTYGSLEELLAGMAFERCLVDGLYDDLDPRDPTLLLCVGTMTGIQIGQFYEQCAASLEEVSWDLGLWEVSTAPCFDIDLSKPQEFTVTDWEDGLAKMDAAFFEIELNLIGELDRP